MTLDPQDPRLDAPAAPPPPPAPRTGGDPGPGLRRIVPISTGPLDMSKDPDRFDATASQPAVVGPLDMSQDPDRYDPTRSTPVGPLDMSQDPDRFDAATFDPAQQPTVVGPLDLSRDPDRMPRPGEGQSLTDLLGKDRSFEENRDGYEWVAGLVAVVAFLALITFIFNVVLTP